MSTDEMKQAGFELARKGISTMFVPVDYQQKSACIVPVSKMSGIDVDLIIIHAARIEVCAKRAVETVVEYLSISGIDPKTADKLIRAAVMKINADSQLEQTRLINPETGKEFKL